MNHHYTRSSTSQEIRNNTGQQFEFTGSAWVSAKQAQWMLTASSSKRTLSMGEHFRQYDLLKYKSHMWTNTYRHPGSCNSCLGYWKCNLILIYKGLQFDPEVIMIMSSSQIIPAWMNLPFSQALYSLWPWRQSCGLLAVTSSLWSCNSFFQFDFWLGSHMVFFVVL